MVRGRDSFVVKFLELSTGLGVSEEMLKTRVLPRTLGTDIVVQPFGRKGPWVQTVLKSIDNEGLAADNDMEKNELFEGGDTLLVDLVDRDAINKREVGRGFYEAVDVKVGRNRLEGSTRSLCWHLVGYVLHTLQDAEEDMCDTRLGRMRVSGTVSRTWKG